MRERVIRVPTMVLQKLEKGGGNEEIPRGFDRRDLQYRG